MSTEQFEKAVQTLREMPEERQQQILDFIAALKLQSVLGAASAELPPGLAWDRGVLVYTGEIVLEDPVGFMREQRMIDLMRRALGC